MIRFKNHDGISLVEVIVAMTLLGVVLTSLASATFQAARRSTTVAAESYRQGILMQEVNHMAVVPWSTLMAWTNGCTTTSGGNFPHQRCIQITGTGNTRSVRIIVTPTVQRARPDTIIFTRTNTPTGNPLNFN